MSSAINLSDSRKELFCDGEVNCAPLPGLSVPEGEAQMLSLLQFIPNAMKSIGHTAHLLVLVSSE